NKAALREKKIAVRVAREALLLPIADCVDGLSRQLDARESFLCFDDNQVPLERLRELNAAAVDLLTLPFRNVAALPDGFIEAVAPGANNVLWFIGWMKRRRAVDFSAVA